MKKHNLLLIILLCFILLFFSCSKKSTENLFSFDEAKLKQVFTKNQSISLQILNEENKNIDSIIYLVNDVKVFSQKGNGNFKFDLKNQKLGYQNLKACVYFDEQVEPSVAIGRIEIGSQIQPKLLKFTVVNTYSHDIESFTQGLEFFDDVLYEGTGLNGKSRLLKTDFKTGKLLKTLAVDSKYFGEGITIINNKIYQLTWQEKTGFIYDAATWKLEKTFKYDKDIEGWGMTNDKEFIYQSDGTEKIWKMNPDNQKMIDYVNVYAGKDKIKSINELEYINGKIFGNVWMKDAIAVINPTTGDVESILNLASLRKLTTAKESDYLNGIAYNPKTKTIFVTGKNWNKLFELKVTE